MTIQTQIDACLLKKDYMEQSICLKELKADQSQQLVHVVGASAILSIIVVGTLLLLHHKTRSKK
jgi:hypothetical protein